MLRNEGKMQIIVYHRLLQGTEIPTQQQQQINQFLNQQGWIAEGRHFVDYATEDVAVVQRRIFRNLLRVTEEKHISTIVCYSPDSFCQHPLERGLATNLLQEYGLEIIYVTGGDKPDEETQQLLQIISKYQQLGLKLETGRRRKRQQSKEEGNVDLKGRGKVGGRQSYRELDAKLVEKVKQLRKEQNSLRQIADLLEKQGYTNSKGNKFNPSQISRILEQ